MHGLRTAGIHSASSSVSPDLHFSYSVGVLTNDPLNPYGLNRLDFIYSFLNNDASTLLISRVQVFPFTLFNTDVGYSTADAFPGGTIVPTTVDRVNAFPLSSVSTVGFNFDSFGPGDQSLALVVKTDATPTALGFGGVIVFDNRGASTGFTAFARVPEPRPVWLLGCSLLAVAAYRRTSASNAQRKSVDASQRI
jgi:hypothetical protein